MECHPLSGYDQVHLLYFQLNTRPLINVFSTQPGGQALASFKVLTLDSLSESQDSPTNCSPGPFGDQDGEQIFVQRVVADTNTLFIRLASTGERLCTIKSIDGSVITAFYVHECEGSNRMGARRRFLFTGMANGTVQVCLSAYTM